MRKIFILFLLLPACTADVFSSGDDSSPPASDAGAFGAPPERFARLAPDAGAAGDAAPETGDAACVLQDHWNGYNAFQSCETAYSQKLALEACAAYFGSGCADLSDAGCGPNVVGAKNAAWILWGWPEDGGGVGRTHESSFEVCPYQPNDPAWW